MADTHKFIGSHPEEINGVFRAPGECFTLTKDELTQLPIRTLLEDGKLLDLTKGGGTP
jgi:hypothetical protein